MITTQGAITKKLTSKEKEILIKSRTTKAKIIAMFISLIPSILCHELLHYIDKTTDASSDPAWEHSDNSIHSLLIFIAAATIAVLTYEGLLQKVLLPKIKRDKHLISAFDEEKQTLITDSAIQKYGSSINGNLSEETDIPVKIFN